MLTAASATQNRQRVLVRPITNGEHTVFARSQAAGFRQTPAWAKVKPGLRAQSVGWFTAGELVGAALVLYRTVPGTRRSLAQVPDGPVLPWATVSAEPSHWLDPFVAHLRSEGAFAVRIGPHVPVRRWSASDSGLPEQLPEQFADGGPLLDALDASGWKPERPSYEVRLDLFRRLPDLLASTGSRWRDELAEAGREGVVVREGNTDDLLTFHRLHVATAAREGTRPQPVACFGDLVTTLRARLYLASGQDGEALAGALVVQNGDVCWTVHVASVSRAAMTAVHWRAITDAHTRGCRAHHLPATTEGSGGDVVQTVGDWEFPLSPFWYNAFRLYPRRAA